MSSGLIWLMTGWLAAMPADSLAPLERGVAAAGQVFDLVLRPTPSGCRLLLSDAASDAPVSNATFNLELFGPLDRTTRAPLASAGAWPGHYLTECPQADEVLTAQLRADGRSDLLALDPPFSSPPTVPLGSRPSPSPLAALVAAWLVVIFGRRRSLWIMACFVAGLVGLASATANAHGTGEEMPTSVVGSAIYLAQEIQFELALRTAPVQLRVFEPPAASSNQAAENDLAERQAPAVRRSAVVERNGTKIVLVRVAPEQFQVREVSLGWTDGEYVAVESGLQPGDLAVVVGAGLLRNGGGRVP